MLSLTSLAMVLVSLVGFASAREFVPTLGAEGNPSFESLRAQAERLIQDTAEEIRRRELVIAAEVARTRKQRKELAEYDQHLRNQVEVFEFVRNRLSRSQDGSVILVGNRGYPQDIVEANVAARREEITDIARRRHDKARQVEDANKSIQQRNAALHHVQKQLSRATIVLDEQNTRRERALQELAVSTLVQHTCPQGELLFASGTELGRLLGDIEITVGTLEALLELRKVQSPIDLSDIRGTSTTIETERESEQ